MPRNVSGVYEKPSGTTAVANETITSAQFNSTIDDLVEDLNAARPVSAGGTGAATAAAARTNLAAFGRDTILGTVSQASGVPTGAIIERSSNDNGQYIRFADGTQFCTFTTTLSLAMDNSWFGGFRSDTQTWTFPVVFSTTPLVFGSAFTNSFGLNARGVSGSSGEYYHTSPSTTGLSNRTAQLMAIGRWF